MLMALSDKAKDLQERLQAFMDDVIYPAEATFHEQHAAQDDRWVTPPIMEELKAKARERGLWNLWLPESEFGAGLSNFEYAHLCEEMGRSNLAPEACNCSAPDTGNMEVLVRYGTPEQQAQWLTPLLAGEIRSAFAMTEPDVASAEATNRQSDIRRAGDEYCSTGRKWWTPARLTHAADFHFHGQDRRYRRASSAAVDDSGAARRPGVTVKRACTSSATMMPPTATPKCCSRTCACLRRTCCWARAAASSCTGAPRPRPYPPLHAHHRPRRARLRGRGCPRQAARQLRQRHRRWGLVPGKAGGMRIDIDQSRLLTLHAAAKMDAVGNKAARKEIAMIKVAAPRMAQRVIDFAIQVHGGGGVSQDFHLAESYAQLRTLRLADGPDEVHLESVAKMELRQQGR